MINSQILTLIWRRKNLFIAVSGIVFGIFVVALLLWPKTYVANAKLLINTKDSRDPAVMATQIDILESTRVANRAVDRLRLIASPAALDRFHKKRESNQTFTQFYADELNIGRSVKANQDTQVINVSYQSRDANFSAQATNAFAQAFLEVTRELGTNTTAIIMDEAAPPRSPYSPKTELILSIALLLAPLLGLIAVVFNEAVDRRVRNRQDLEETTGTNVLCIVGYGRPSRTVYVFRTMFGFLFSKSSLKAN